MNFPALYLIADPSLYKIDQNHLTDEANLFFSAVNEAIAGGVSLIQYRDKSRPRREMFEIAKKLRAMTLREKVGLIMNDEVDLALAVDADGVHLGQDDFPVEMARRLLGEEAVIGLSTHTLSEAREAEKRPVDYIGFGPIFETGTKVSGNRPVGIEAIDALKKQGSLPIYAIGGIQWSHLPAIVSAGATGVAVASALAGVSRAEVRAWQTCLKQAVSSP